MTKGSRPDQWGASPVRAALTRKVTPLSLAIFTSLDLFFIFIHSFLCHTARLTSVLCEERNTDWIGANVS